MLAKLIISLIFLCGLGFSAGPFSGTYYSDGLVFYLVHTGGDLTIDLRLFKTKEGFRGAPVLNSHPAAFFSIAGPDEKILEKRYWYVQPGQTGQDFQFHFPAAAAGVWQIRNAFTSNANMAIELGLRPRLKYGVLLSRCRMLTEDLANFSRSYFLVPGKRPYFQQPSVPGGALQSKLQVAVRGEQTELTDRNGRYLGQCDQFEIFGGQPDLYGNSNRALPFGTRESFLPANGKRLLLQDEQGQMVLKLASDNAAAIAVREGEVYQLTLEGPETGYVSLDGFPVILCPDAGTARAIGGSVVRSPDGKVFAHQFQLKMYEWMMALQPRDLEVQAVPLTERQAAWLADPGSLEFLPVFAYAPHLFLAQQIDREKPGYGDAPVNIESLSLLYSLNRPFNPYYGNPNLMRRTLLHYFVKCLALSENGLMFDDPEAPGYCGGTEWVGWEGMTFCADYLSAAMMKGLADPALLELWQQALGMQIHRFWNARLSCENQSLHWPLKTYALAMATGDPLYRRMAADHARDLADPELSESMKTGYLMEAYGCDATYIGISTSLLAFAQRFSGDDALLPVLQRVYDFLNHTVVREPGGRLAAANGFSPRTLGSWLNCQYGGGIELMADRLEAAAVHSRRVPPTPELLREKYQAYSGVSLPADFAGWLKNAKPQFQYDMDPWIPLWYQSFFAVGAPVSGAQLPHEKSRSFQKNFNDEFLAQRTPAYYAFFYTGNRSWRSHQQRSFRTPFPEGAGFRGNEIFASETSRPWMPMQGMQLFWTPKFGLFLCARNWSMYTHHLTRVEQNGEVVDFPTSFSSECSFENDRLLTRGRSRFLGLSMHREVQLLPGGLDITVHVSAAERTGAPLCLVEQIPFLRKAGLHFERLGEESGKISGLGVTGGAGAGILLQFSRPVQVREGLDSRAVQNPPDLRIGLLELLLSDTFEGSGPMEFRYSMRADDDKE